MLKLNLSKLSPELRDCARELLPQIGLAEADCGLTVEAMQWDNGLSVTAGSTVRLTPVWKLTTDTGSFLINGLSREVIPAA